MKNKRFRVISLVLVLVLALQFVPVVSASGNTGTVEWRDQYDYLWYAVISKSSEVTRTTKVEQTAVTHEGYGYTTPFISGEYPVYYHVNFNFPAAYDTYLRQAAADVSIQETFYETVHLSTNDMVVPDYESFGTYCATVTIFGNTCPYRVDVVREIVTDTEVSGTLLFAPYACGRVMTGYEVW